MQLSRIFSLHYDLILSGQKYSCSKSIQMGVRVILEPKKIGSEPAFRATLYLKNVLVKSFWNQILVQILCSSCRGNGRLRILGRKIVARWNSSRPPLEVLIWWQQQLKAGGGRKIIWPRGLVQSYEGLLRHSELALARYNLVSYILSFLTFPAQLC